MVTWVGHLRVSMSIFLALARPPTSFQATRLSEAGLRSRPCKPKGTNPSKARSKWGTLSTTSSLGSSKTIKINFRSHNFSRNQYFDLLRLCAPLFLQFSLCQQPQIRPFSSRQRKNPSLRPIKVSDYQLIFEEHRALLPVFVTRCVNIDNARQWAP